MSKYSVGDREILLDVGDTIGHVTPFHIIAIVEDRVWCKTIDGRYMVVSMDAAIRAKKVWKEVSNG